MKIEVLKARDNSVGLDVIYQWKSISIKLAKWKKYPHDKFAAYKIYESEIYRWVENHPVHMWKYDDDAKDNCYLFTEEMESWFLLRWA